MQGLRPGVLAIVHVTEKSEQLQHAIDLLAGVRKLGLLPDVITCSGAISAILTMLAMATGTQSLGDSSKGSMACPRLRLL